MQDIENEKKSKEIILPKIISASRVTDIPAFYSDWLIDKFEKNYVEKINPFNQKKSYVGFDDVRFIVFWSKYPEPLFEKLKYFDQKNINYYFQFTLNYYPEFELNLPSLEKRIDIFKKLSDKIGKEKIIWRFDPLILSDKIDEEILLERIFRIGEKIHPFTEKLVFSFVDLKYQKVKNNLQKNGLSLKYFENDSEYYLAEEISKISKQWKINVATCAAENDFFKFGISKNKCIDDELISKIAFEDSILMNYLGCYFDIFEKKIICKKAKKDYGQRKLCNCMKSKDIGFYDSCLHQCIYCYANRNFNKSKENYSNILSKL